MGGGSAWVRWWDYKFKTRSKIRKVNGSNWTQEKMRKNEDIADVHSFSRSFSQLIDIFVEFAMFIKVIDRNFGNKNLLYQFVNKVRCFVH